MESEPFTWQARIPMLNHKDIPTLPHISPWPHRSLQETKFAIGVLLLTPTLPVCEYSYSFHLLRCKVERDPKDRIVKGPTDGNSELPLSV